MGFRTGRIVAFFVWTLAAPAATPSESVAATPLVEWQYDQVRPAVAYNPENDTYLVVWEDHHWGFGSDWDVYGRLVAGDGTPLGAAFGIGFAGEQHRLAPTVAYNPQAHEFLVVYEYEYSAGDHDLYARRVSAAGTPVGDETPLVAPGDFDALPALAYDPAANEYLLVWQRRVGMEAPFQWDVIGIRVSAAAATIGGGIAVATGSASQSAPALAYGSLDDQYLVVWQQPGADGRTPDVYGQRVAASGALVGGAIPISTAGLAQAAPRVAFDTVEGHYLVVWEDSRAGTDQGRDVYGQRVTAGGFLEGVNFAIAGSGDAANRSHPAIAYHPAAGDFVVAFEAEASPTDPDVWNVRVGADGPVAGSEFAISYTAAPETRPAVAAGSGESFLVAWEDGRNQSPDAGLDVWVERVRIPLFSGHVFSGEVGDRTSPLSGVRVRLYCSGDSGTPGALQDTAFTDATGWYGVAAGQLCEYFHVVASDLPGYESAGAQSAGGTVIDVNWIRYSLPLGGSPMAGNDFWDRPVPLPSATPSRSPTSPATPTASRTATRTATPTATVTPSASPTPTRTRTASATPSGTATATRSGTPSSTATATRTGTATASPAPTLTATSTPAATSTASATSSATATATRSLTPSPSATATRTGTASPTPTVTITFTPTATRTAGVTPSRTATVTASRTPSRTATETSMPTGTAPPSATPVPTATTSAQGYPSWQFTGRVTGPRGAPLAGVEVRLVGGSVAARHGQLLDVARTSDDGTFEVTYTGMRPQRTDFPFLSLLIPAAGVEPLRATAARRGVAVAGDWIRFESAPPGAYADNVFELRVAAVAGVEPRPIRLCAALDAWVASDAPNASSVGSTFARTGHVGAAVYRALARFDPSWVPAGTVFESAEIQAYLTAAGGAGSVEVGLHPVLAAWDGGVTWNNQPAAGDSVAVATVGTAAGDYTWPVTGLARGWLDGSVAAHGVELRGPETGADWLRDFGNFLVSKYVRLVLHRPKQALPVPKDPLAPRIALSPDWGETGAEVVVGGYNLPPSTTLSLYWDYRATATLLGQAATDSLGSLTATVRVPSTTDVVLYNGVHNVLLYLSDPIEGAHRLLAQAPFVVEPRCWRQSPLSEAAPAIAVSPEKGSKEGGNTVQVTGSGWPPNLTLLLFWDEQPTPASFLALVTTDPQGKFAKQVTIPAPVAGPSHLILARGFAHEDPTAYVLYAVAEYRTTELPDPPAGDVQPPTVQVEHAFAYGTGGGPGINLYLTATAWDPPTAPGAHNGVTAVEITAYAMGQALPPVRDTCVIGGFSATASCSHTERGPWPAAVTGFFYFATATDRSGNVATSPVKFAWLVDYGPDSDNDGLADNVEDLICTDRDNPDTDRDNLLDGCEVKGYRLPGGAFVDLPSMGAHPCVPDSFV